MRCARETHDKAREREIDITHFCGDGIGVVVARVAEKNGVRSKCNFINFSYVKRCYFKIILKASVYFFIQKY